MINGFPRFAERAVDLSVGIVQRFVQNLRGAGSEFALQGLTGTTQDRGDLGQHFAHFVAWQQLLLSIQPIEPGKCSRPITTDATVTRNNKACRRNAYVA